VDAAPAQSAQPQPPAVSPWGSAAPEPKKKAASVEKGPSLLEIQAEEERQRKRLEEQKQLASVIHNAAQAPKPSNAAGSGAGRPAWGSSGAATGPSLLEIQQQEASRAQAQAAVAKKTEGKVKAKKKAVSAAQNAPKKAPISFLDIQRAEEEERKRHAAAQKAAGIVPVATGWSSAAGGSAASGKRGATSITTSLTSGRSSSGKDSGSGGDGGGGGGGNVWGSNKSASAIIGKPKPVAKVVQPAAPKAVPKAAPKVIQPVASVIRAQPKQPKQAPPKAQPAAQQPRKQAPVAAAGDGFWDTGPTKATATTTTKKTAASEGDEFNAWCKREIISCNPEGVDVDTFVEMLSAFGDDEVMQWVQEYIGTSAKASQFARNFVSRRRGKGWHVAGGSKAASSDPKPSTGASKSKKKKKKGQKIDPSLLTYGVASTGGANRGEIDSWQTTNK